MANDELNISSFKQETEENERQVLIIDNSSNLIDESGDNSNYIMQREAQGESLAYQDIMILQDISSRVDNHSKTPQMDL